MSTGFKFAVKQIDHGWNAILKEMREAKGAYVKVGVLGTPRNLAAQPNGRLPNVALAAVQEFGSPKRHIPARHWIRGTFATQRAAYTAQLALLLRGVVRGETKVRNVLRQMGRIMARDLKTRLRGGSGLGTLALATIRRRFERGSMSTGVLDDTGKLISSIGFKVVMGRRRGPKPR